MYVVAFEQDSATIPDVGTAEADAKVDDKVDEDAGEGVLG